METCYRVPWLLLAPCDIRHLLTHTSGLREWRTLERIAGWPHRAREYTFATMLDIFRRQRALNFEPGSTFCYTIGNYNLAAVVVARVADGNLDGDFGLIAAVSAASACNSPGVGLAGSTRS